MPDEPNIPPKHKLDIELEALPDVVVDPNRGYQPGYYPGISQRGDYGIPIPDMEGYHCPNCDYDVRRLTGRICPECGEHFTWGAARNAGLSKAPEVKIDYCVITQHRWTVYASILLYFAALGAPYIVRLKAPTSGDIAFQMMFLVPFAFTGMLYCYSLMKPARDGFFVSALLYAAFSLVLIILL